MAPNRRLGNHYKNSLTRRRTRRRQRVFMCAKLAGSLSVLCLISSVFVFGHDFLTQCSYFKAAYVTVDGTQRLSDKDVRRQALIDIGTNILALNMSMTRKRLMAHTWIAEAEVRREFPNGIRIRIEEHRPLAALNLGRKLIINTHGEIFKAQSKSDKDQLPLISGLGYQDINIPGQPRSRPFKAVMSILTLGQKPGSILPNKLIKRIHVDPDIGITLFAFDGRKAIKMGYTQYEHKYDRLRNVLYFLNQRNHFSGFESIDLNNMNRIVVNPIRIELPARGRKEV